MRFHNKKRDNLLIPVTFVHVYMFYIWNNTDLLKNKKERNEKGTFVSNPKHLRLVLKRTVALRHLFSTQNKCLDLRIAT